MFMQELLMKELKHTQKIIMRNTINLLKVKKNLPPCPNHISSDFLLAVFLYILKNLLIFPVKITLFTLKFSLSTIKSSPQHLSGHEGEMTVKLHVFFQPWH
jgi:hypothetical protein